MDYSELLEHSYKVCKSYDDTDSRYEFLSTYVFDFTTYDSEMDEFLAKKALEVAIAVTDKKTFEYQENKENYIWYITMCNMPFFARKLEWGMSIRGAWWAIYGEDTFEINSCGLFIEDEQLLNIRFNESQWLLFIRAMQDFVRTEDRPKTSA